MSYHFQLLLAVEEKRQEDTKDQGELHRLMRDDAAFLVPLRRLYSPKALLALYQAIQTMHSWEFGAPTGFRAVFDPTDY